MTQDTNTTSGAADLPEARRNLGPEDHELRDRIDRLLRDDAARAAQEGKSHDNT